MFKRYEVAFKLQTFDRPRSWKAPTHSRLVDSGTFSLSINGVQASWEGSVRTHSTFSGTLKKSKFKGADLALLEDFLLLGSSEPSADCRVANQEKQKDEWEDLNIPLGAKEGKLSSSTYPI